MIVRRRVPRLAAWESRLLGLVAIALVVFGIAAVYSSSSIVAVQRGLAGSTFAFRQFSGAILGFIMLLIGARLDYALWRKLAWPFAGVAAFLLIVPLLPFTHELAPVRNGARRWIDLGFFTIQPSEVAKFAVIAWTAMLAAKKGPQLRDFKLGILPFVVILTPMVLLIALEPDLSTATITALLAAIVIFVGGARIGHFLLIGVLVLPFLGHQLMAVQFRLQRMTAFLSPGADPLDGNWQVGQSLIGIGSGGLMGVGFGEGLQKLGYLPHAYSDFIFSAIGEEWGFVGVSFLLFLYSLFIFLGLRISRRAPDSFGTLLAVGLTAMIGVTAIFHVAVTMALVPATGLPLPFVSYGRSNLLMALLATGVIMSIGESGIQGRSRR